MNTDPVKTININGKWLFPVDGLLPKAAPPPGSSVAAEAVTFALLADDLKPYGSRGQFTAIAQFYELVIPGLILPRHIFQGLERPLCYDDDMEADEQKLIYSQKPEFDYEWIGGLHGRTQRRQASPRKVFVVIISPNERYRQTYPGIAGWIERWNWVDEDRDLRGAPMNWVDRYSKKLYTTEVEEENTR